jgi:hypothetical protein
MRNTLILIGIPLWIIWGLIWILPLKLKLLRLHGQNKSNAFFIQLAKQGDPIAAKVYLRTKILIFVGLIAGGVMVFTK